MPGFELSRDSGVSTLTLNGARRNALGAERYAAIVDAADSIAAGEVLVLRAEGPHFCAGQDLDEFHRAATAGRAEAALRHGASAILALLRCRGTVVTAAQGAAVGGGALLIAASDVVLLAEDAWLSLPELRLGMPLGHSVAELLLPGPTVRRMMLTGARLSAAEAGSLGAARLAAPDDLVRVTAETVDALGKLNRDALSAARSLWVTASRVVAAERYSQEVDLTASLLRRRFAN